MDFDTSQMTPEERLSNDLCPECGQPLKGLDAEHHSLQHWPQFIRPDGRNQEAMRRQALFADYIKAHPPTPASQQMAGTEPASGSKPAKSPPPPPPSFKS